LKQNESNANIDPNFRLFKDSDIMVKNKAKTNDGLTAENKLSTVDTQCKNLNTFDLDIFLDETLLLNERCGVRNLETRSVEHSDTNQVLEETKGEFLDVKPPWRIQYENGCIPWVSEFDFLKGSANHFRVKVLWQLVEQQCKDNPSEYGKLIHEQRVDYFSQVCTKKILHTAFNEIIEWHPKSTLIDGFKWANFARKMKFLSDLSNSSYEVDMAFTRQSRKRKDRKLDLDGFRALIQDLSVKQYSNREENPEEALHKLLWNTVVMMPAVNCMAWNEAKYMAIKQEAKRICAQIRIASLHRKKRLQRTFRSARLAQISLGCALRKHKSKLELERLLREHHSHEHLLRVDSGCKVIQSVWRFYQSKRHFMFRKKQILHAKITRCLEMRNYTTQREFLVFSSVVPKIKALQDLILPIYSTELEQSGRLYHLVIYKTVSNYVFRAYNSKTSGRLCNQISILKLKSWLEEESQDGKLEIGRQLIEISDILKLEFQRHLMSWLSEKVLIRIDECSGKDILVLLYDWNVERRSRAATIIQGIPRMHRAKIEVRSNIHRIYEKYFDRFSRCYYYMNTVTESASWTKPILLGPDDIKAPRDEWREVSKKNEGTESSKYYFNPGTGQTSWMSVESAARLLQKKFRSHFLVELLGSRLSFQKVAKALEAAENARAKFELNPNKLANKVNFALLCHCITFDGETAHNLYTESIRQSPAHPVIARAYGIFLLANCEQPRESKFQKALDLFRDAKVGDPEGTLFESAEEYFFRWSVAAQPANPMALLNYALLQQCVLGNNIVAEKLYRKALSVDPGNINVMTNFEDFERRRYPGGAFAEYGPSYYHIKGSRVIEEKVDWGEWVKMKDPICPVAAFGIFWFNKRTRVARFEEPDWKVARH